MVKTHTKSVTVSQRDAANGGYQVLPKVI